MVTLTALSLTPSARDWLATTTTARVLNTFDRACNLINQDAAILALVTSERGLNPFAMVVASADPTIFQAVSTTSAVSVEAPRLVVGPLQINVASASLWNPMPDWPALRQMFADHPARFEELVSTVMELAIGGSLLDLYLTPRPLARLLTRPSTATSLRSVSAQGAASGEGVPEVEDPANSGAGVRQQALLDRARRGAIELVHGLLTRSTEQCLAGAKALAGLGGGLTPAGDDFIVGVMLATWAGLYGSGAEALRQPIVEAAAPLTTTLSAAYLRAAARGECMAQWHALFEALLCSGAQAMRAAMRALMAIGHTSGADTLAGFLAVHYTAHGIIR